MSEEPSASGTISVGVQKPAPNLVTVREAAAMLSVSESWIRRNICELPATRVGRLIRLDSKLLLQQFRSKQNLGNRLRPERKIMGPKRYQRGSVYKRGKGIKVWYGMWREDVPTADGQLVRRQRKVRLGTVGEMPTRSAALAMLSELMSITPVVELSFGELVERWKEAVVPTIKGTTATYYLKTLRAHVGPAFGVMSIRNISRYDVEAFLAGKASAYCRNTLRGMRVGRTFFHARSIFSSNGRADWGSDCNQVVRL